MLFFVSFFGLGQTFTYSGYIYNADGTGAVNVPVKLYKRTTPVMNGFTSQTNYNGHSYYRSTGVATWTTAKSACEAMNGHLATISNASENTFLFNTWPSGWIGYYQDRVAGYTYSEPTGGYRWTETQVTSGLDADYDVSSYTSGPTLVDIKSSINATLYNSPTYSSTGGKYLTFNGSNQYAITNNLASKFTSTAISVVAWIYPTGNGVIASELNIPSTTSGWHESIIEITGSNTLRVGFWNGTGITQLNTPITLNTWNMVCITYDGTTMRGYLNNVSFGSVNFSRQAAFIHGGNGQQHFAFGLNDATNMGSGAFGSFRLGDIQFFDRAITVDEIDRTTPWVLFQTVYTNSSGYYSFSQPTNPAVEWYLQYDAPTPVTTLQITDMVEVSKLVLGITPIKSIHYHRYDVNYDGKINVADENYINLRRYNFFNSWVTMSPARLFTPAQYTTLTTNTTDLRVTIPGVSSITINSPVSGGSQNYYLIAPGYKTTVNY